MKTFSELLQMYFTERLMKECNASPHTIANYRDTFRLLIAYAQQELKKSSTELAMEELKPEFILRFLHYLEKERRNSARSRNVRLAGIRSFFIYVALREPALGGVAQQILAIRSKRFTKRPVDFLSRSEIESINNAPDKTNWSGRLDRKIQRAALQTV
jgi:site-specific recombinase XerD